MNMDVPGFLKVRIYAEVLRVGPEVGHGYLGALFHYISQFACGVSVFRLP